MEIQVVQEEEIAAAGVMVAVKKVEINTSYIVTNKFYCI